MSRLLASATDPLTADLALAALAPEDVIARPSGSPWRRRHRGISRRIEAVRTGTAVVVTMTQNEAVAIQYAVAAAPDLPWSATSSLRVGWGRRMICNYAADGAYEIRESEPVPGAFPAVWVTP